MPRKHSDADFSRRIAERFGARLRASRQSHGLTQEALAEQIEITPEAYGRLERGVALPSYPTMMRLCDSLEVSTDDLLLEGGSLVLKAKEPADSVELNELRRFASRLPTRQLKALVSLVRELAPVAKPAAKVAAVKVPARGGGRRAAPRAAATRKRRG